MKRLPKKILTDLDLVKMPRLQFENLRDGFLLLAGFGWVKEIVSFRNIETGLQEWWLYDRLGGGK